MHLCGMMLSQVENHTPRALSQAVHKTPWSDKVHAGMFQCAVVAGAVVLKAGCCYCLKKNKYITWSFHNLHGIVVVSPTERK